MRAGRNGGNTRRVASFAALDGLLQAAQALTRKAFGVPVALPLVVELLPIVGVRADRLEIAVGLRLWGEQFAARERSGRSRL